MLVIGVGNPMRGDDAAGPIAAEKLAGFGLETRVLDADGTHLIEAFEGRRTVVVIDAMRATGKPGTIHRIDGARLPLSSDLFHYSSHAFGVAEAIETARALEILPPHLTVYGIEGAMFTAGEPQTRAVAAAIDEVVADIVGEAD